MVSGDIDTGRHRRSEFSTYMSYTEHPYKLGLEQTFSNEVAYRSSISSSARLSYILHIIYEAIERKSEEEGRGRGQFSYHKAAVMERHIADSSYGLQRCFQPVPDPSRTTLCICCLCTILSRVRVSVQLQLHTCIYEYVIAQCPCIGVPVTECDDE